MPSKPIKNRKYTKDALLSIIDKTYDNSRYLMRLGIDDNCDLSAIRSCFTSELWTKQQVVEAINKNDEPFCTMPENRGLLILGSNLAISKNSINANEVFITTDIEEYEHLFIENNPHFEVYWSIPKESRIILFKLGDRYRSCVLIQNSRWAFKLSRSGGELLCGNIDHLIKTLKDDQFSYQLIHIGRTALKIKGLVE